jgi:hypothetical protein
MLDVALRLTNGAITLLIFILLLNYYRRTSRRVYLYWSAGFLFYGANIMVRLFAPSVEMNPLGFLAFLLNSLGFVLIITGIGELINKTKTVLLVTLIIQVTLILASVLTGSSALAWVILLTPHLLVILSLGYAYARFRVDVRLMALGWVPILLANAALASGLLNIAIVDLISGASKIVIYRGMARPTFSQIVESLRTFMLGGLAAEYGTAQPGGLYLVDLGKPKKTEAQWIKARIEDNKRKGTRTILLSMYGLMTPSQITDNDGPQDFFLIDVRQGQISAVKGIEGRSMVVNDSLNEIRIVLSDILAASRETTALTEVIVYTLSYIVHTHGWNQVYSMLLSMIKPLKESNVRLTCLYHPETHKEKDMVARMEALAEDIIRA